MRTNPTLDEIKDLECRIAEKVMEFRRDSSCIKTWFWRPCDSSHRGERLVHVVGGMTAMGAIRWSPWRDPGDALEVLKRVQLLQQEEGGNLPGFWIRQWWGDGGGMYGVQVGDGLRAEALGPHFGPAVCLMAEKCMMAGGAARPEHHERQEAVEELYVKAARWRDSMVYEDCDFPEDSELMAAIDRIRSLGGK